MRNIGITILAITIVITAFTIMYLPLTEPEELVGQGIVQEMRVVDPSLGPNTYIIQIMGKEYMVYEDDYFLTEIGDNIQLWKRPGSTISSVRVIWEVV